MGDEASKSALRRMNDERFTNTYLVGNGIDIGAGNDCFGKHKDKFPNMINVRGWDKNDGNATLMEGIIDETYDFVLSSHCLEHLERPSEGIMNWFRILKPGGHMIITVPDEDLYEQGTFPNHFNSDHKWTFTIYKEYTWHYKSINIFDLIKNLDRSAQVLKIELIDLYYDYTLKRSDQTKNKTECAIEVIIRKRHKEEVKKGGRFNV